MKDEKLSAIQQFFNNDSVFSVESTMLLAGELVSDARLRKILTYGSLGYSLGRRASKFVKEKREARADVFTLRLEEDTDPFNLVSTWMLEAVSEASQKDLSLYRRFTKREESSAIRELAEEFGLDLADDDDDDLTVPDVETTGGMGNLRNVGLRPASDSVPVTLNRAGHSYVAEYIIPEAPAAQNGMPMPSPTEYPYLRITCESHETRRAFIEHLNDALESAERRRPALYQVSEWGDVSRSRDAPNRALDTVILKPGQIETLVSDLRRFLMEEKYYTDLGIPYHRGVLLYGMPGTGKTSIAAAVADALELDIYHASLSSLASESALKKMLGSVTPRSVLLLEEVDACGAVVSDTSRGLQRDALLQALDGFTAPHGLITIMTTNHIERLDPAFIRPGRADLRLEIGAVDHNQVQRLCARFIEYVPEDLPEIKEEHGIVPADIIEVFKRHLRDKKAAGPALVEALNMRILEQELDFVNE